jgi:hypothetical protein
MDVQLLVICLLTFVIHLIGTLAYAVRLTGVRTRRIAVSLALFNILVLVSRTSNSFQGPFLAKRVEETLLHPGDIGLLHDLRWILASAAVATAIGGFLIPTFQRLFSRAVLHFQVHRSIPQLILHAFFRGGMGHIRDSVCLPASANLKQLSFRDGLTSGVFFLNLVAVALWTVGVFAALYAGFLNPELRVTASTLSSVVNGVATVLMLVFIDPPLSMMTDDVLEGRVSEPSFRQSVIWLVGSRFCGTVLAQFLLVPSAVAIGWIAQRV